MIETGFRHQLLFVLLLGNSTRAARLVSIWGPLCHSAVFCYWSGMEGLCSLSQPNRFIAPLQHASMYDIWLILQSLPNAISRFRGNRRPLYQRETIWFFSSVISRGYEISPHPLFLSHFFCCLRNPDQILPLGKCTSLLASALCPPCSPFFFDAIYCIHSSMDFRNHHHALHKSLLHSLGILMNG